MNKRSLYSAQAPSAVVMIRPHHFTVNTETAIDNHFQQNVDLGRDLARPAYDEVTRAAETLTVVR